MHVELTIARKIRGEMRKRSNRGGDCLPHERYVYSRLVFSGNDPINIHPPQRPMLQRTWNGFRLTALHSNAGQRPLPTDRSQCIEQWIRFRNSRRPFGDLRKKTEQQIDTVMLTRIVTRIKNRPVNGMFDLFGFNLSINHRSTGSLQNLRRF